MQKYSLEGEWQLQVENEEQTIKGYLPGCNYLDYIENGLMDDPFWGLNEEEATKFADKDIIYSRHFLVNEALLQCKQVNLVISGLDTLAEITLNGVTIGSADNAHRTWRFDVTKYLHTNENEITILIKSPRDYMKRDSTGKSLLEKMAVVPPNIAKIRKPQCHFGWDWGPILPPAGISGEICLEGSEVVQIEQVKIEQIHSANNVEIHAAVEVVQVSTEDRPIFALLKLTELGGREFLYKTQMKSDNMDLLVTVNNPQLWWCNGLGGQPLYDLTITVLDDTDQELDQWSRKIGLRSLMLDTSKDEWGNNFRFIVNGVPIFAKGADWIPSDSFVTRTTVDDLDFYIKSAHDANMNMLRVWGGGYYESDTFYDLCDKYGILVWQDLGFACNKYPLEDEAFLLNVEQEIKDNARRLRHHASLALWCGNNEIFMLDFGGKKKSDFRAIQTTFFYKTLQEWIQKDDKQTPYWPGSPSSGDPNYKANGLNWGDTHLWQVWHGLMPIESFEKYPTRFCSEYGMESMPSMRIIRTFTEKSDLNLFDPEMLAHQKSVGGNKKMLFYLLSKYRSPAEFEDFIYLSQLIQSETIRMATEFWRRNVGRCNGAIYWQYNDCWPVASWAGIDYGKNYKAVQYRAKHFNAMCCVSGDMRSKYCHLHVINDYANGFTGKLRWMLTDFAGKGISDGELPVDIGETRAEKIITLTYKEILHGRKKKEVVLLLELLDAEGKVVSRQNNLLVSDKEAILLKPKLETLITVENNVGTLRIETNTYARYVYVEIDGVTVPLSDNFFDVQKGQPVTVCFPVLIGTSSDELQANLHIKTLADVVYKGSILNDKLIRFLIRLDKTNLLMWIIFKFI